MTATNHKRSTLTCAKCDLPFSFIHIEGLALALRETKASLRGDRVMRASWVSVCPSCDAYLLMREFTWGVPFYSPMDLAVITIDDYGREQAAILFEFGNLPFSLNALTGSLEALRHTSTQSGAIAVNRLDRNLLGPTGIPDDDSAEAEWIRQIDLLVPNLPEPVAIGELDAAVRNIIRQVPDVGT